MPEAQGRLTLWGAEVFLAVAEGGAISAAARRLGVTPPAVSQQLAATEAALGVTLFDRSARPFTLTAAGALFRRHAQTILNAEAEARADLAQAHLGRHVTLRLGVIEDFDAEVTPVWLSGLARDLPETRLLLETGPSHRLLDQLEARSLDLVVAAEMGAGLPGGAAVDSGWRDVRPLLTEPFVQVRPREAAPDLPLILYSARHLMGRQIAAHRAAQTLRPPVRFELDSYTAILALVAQGAGWTILTPLALHHASRFLDRVEVRPLPGAPLTRSLSLSTRAGSMAEIAGRAIPGLKSAIEAHLRLPTVRRWPWLAPGFHLL